MTKVVSRLVVVNGSYKCPKHGAVIDVIFVSGKTFCTSCLGEASSHSPWFYTGSPFGQEILDLGVKEL